MTIKFCSNDKDLEHYAYLYWVIGSMKKVIDRAPDKDERLANRLKEYEKEIEKLKEKLKRRES